MRPWKLCDQDFINRHFQLESELPYYRSRGAYELQYSKVSLKKNAKPFQKTNQKISLRGVRDHHKKKNSQDISHKSTKQNNMLVSQVRKVDNSNNFIFRSQQKFNAQKILSIQREAKKYNHQVSEQYYGQPSSPTLATRNHNPYKVKINFYSPVQRINFNPETIQVTDHQTSQKMQQKDQRCLKRMQTLPDLLPSNFLLDQSCKQQVQKKQAELSKSMDYNETIKLTRLKATQNLHQIQCIKAESLLDSQENRDQVSIVISPFSDEHNFTRSQLFRNDLWNAHIAQFTQPQEASPQSSPSLAQSIHSAHSVHSVHSINSVHSSQLVN